MSEPGPKSRGIVLVIEDEPVLRLMAVDVVEQAGFEALEACGASEALLILEGRNDVRIVFSDVALGAGLDGIALAALIRDRWPPIEFVFTSGKRRPDPTELPARAAFFEQPYRHDEVVAAILRLTV